MGTYRRQLRKYASIGIHKRHALYFFLQKLVAISEFWFCCSETWLVGGLIAAAVVAIAALCCILAMAKKEKEGKPVFAPVHNPVNERVAEKA